MKCSTDVLGHFASFVVVVANFIMEYGVVESKTQPDGVS